MKPAVGGARRKAREILRDHARPRLPIDIDGLVVARGIQVHQVPAIRPGVFAAFYIDGAECGILLSHECFSPSHRRFTLAHELGHFVLDGHADELLAGGTQAVSLGGNFRDQNSRTEREADVFAAELLLPSDRIAPWLPSRPSSALCPQVAPSQ